MVGAALSPAAGIDGKSSCCEAGVVLVGLPLLRFDDVWRSANSASEEITIEMIRVYTDLFFSISRFSRFFPPF
jgi:hypothetical protein